MIAVNESLSETIILSVSLSLSICLSDYIWNIHLSIFLSIHAYTQVSIYLSMHVTDISIDLSIYLPIYPYQFLASSSIRSENMISLVRRSSAKSLSTGGKKFPSLSAVLNFDWPLTEFGPQIKSK